MRALEIRPADAALDFLALGAMVVRLDPGIVPFRRARSLEVHVSGGEYNVAANLTSCFGLRAGIATAMVDHCVGELVEGQIREMGVTAYFRRFCNDGVRGPNIATVYSDKGHGVRAPVVSYNRANEAGAMLKPGDFDWDEIFSMGIRWFHSGGIFASLSESTSELILEGMQAARRFGAVCSFDLNYRPKLWSTLYQDEAKGCAVFRSIAAEADVIFGSELDFQLRLGIQKPNSHSSAPLRCNSDPDCFFEMMDFARAELPRLKCVATTRRDIHSSNRHDWTGLLWSDSDRFVSPTMQLDVMDRIGSGDGFSSGVIYGLLIGREPREALRLGWAHGALLTTYPGDVSMARREEVEALARGGSAAVQR
jgi:2-dehydro-3-deoxygluconokinase